MELFHEAWYRDHRDEFEGDALEHFCRIGWHEGSDPHPLFDVRYYLTQLRHPLSGGIDPLDHFISVGAREGLNPHPLFDTAFYMARYADSLDGLDPLTHYLRKGATLKYDPHPLFNTDYYVTSNPDVAESEMNPLFHYATIGGIETRRQPHPLFDSSMYAQRRHLPKEVNPLVDFILRLELVRELTPDERPHCSVIILNWNKSLMTLQCVVDALDSEGARELEVIVVDNGSRPDEFAILTQLIPPDARVIRLSTNRYFGEGNNIGAQAARGRLLLFLNNDAFLQKSTYRALKRVLEDFADAGAVGPKLLYPDGRIQEAGGLVSADGTITQRGKYLANQPDRYPLTERVDYVSASCLLMRRRDFDQIAGFDLLWDPAYYEDVDLCLKLLLLDKRTYYCGDTAITHIENATSTDPSHGLRLNTVVEVNREKFISRWYEFLASGRDRNALQITLPSRVSGHRRPLPNTAILYTPYPLYPGGGERYLLTIAQALSTHYRTVVVTPERYSTHRLRTIGEELHLDVNGLELVPKARIGELSACDLFIAMGNEVLPPIAAIGRRNIFICQFPFPMHANHVAEAWGTLDEYDQVIVYSQFAAYHFRRHAQRIAKNVPPVAILAPPVPTYWSPLPQPRLPGSIISVGRFTSGGHCKRQDSMIEAFQLLVEQSGRDDLELNLVGAVPPDAESRDYLRDLRERAQDLPVRFHLGAPPAKLADLYQRASVYWHATGYMVWEKFFPERLEHFGIAVVEAMSAGTLPFVCANGGPPELVDDGVTGFLWRSEAELVEKTMRLFSMPEDESQKMRTAAHRQARRFEPFRFQANLFALLDGSADETAPASTTASFSTGIPIAR